MTIAPDFGDAVVDDVRDGKDEQSCRRGERTDRNDLGAEQIGGDQARAEHDAHHQEGDRNRIFHDPCFLRG